MPIGNRYLLFEAYDLLGKHLFGPDWRHDEYLMKPDEMVPFDKVARHRQATEQKMQNIGVQMREAQDALKKTENKTAQAAIKKDITELSKAHSRLYEEWQQHPKADDHYKTTEERTKRHKVTLNTLLEGLREDKIKVILSNHAIVRQDFWKGRKGFKYWLSYSMVVMSPYDSGARRAAAFIDCLEFDTWRLQIEPISNPDAELSPDAKCERWLKEKVAQGKKEHNKTWYREKAREEIANLSANAFDRIWQNNVPEYWKQGGRPRLK